MSKGEFSADAISGALTLQGRLDDVSISDVQGNVSLDGDFFGDTDLAHIAAPVHFHSSRTDVEVASIPGDLAIDSGDLQLNNATGLARISTSAKDVECTGIAGDLHVEDGDGDISVARDCPAGRTADPQPQWRHPPDRAPGRRFSTAGDGQERQYRLQAGPARP